MATTTQPPGTTKLEQQPDIAEKSSINSIAPSSASNTDPTDVEKSSTPLQSQAAVTPADPPPDGGLQAWLVVAGGFCTVFASFGWINCIGIFQAYYASNQLKEYSTSTVSWIPSTESCMMFLGGPLVGFLTDNYGPKIPLFVGSFLHIFGLMMTSISKEYYEFFLSQSVVSAIGCSFLFFSTLAATATWFARHRALAFGIVVAGSSIGGVILPIMVQQLIPRIGFGWAMRSLAFLLLGMLIIGNVLIKSRLPPPKRNFALKEFITPFKERAFLFLTISNFFLYVGGFLGITFLVSEAKTRGMSVQMAGYLVPIMNAASTFGRIIPAQIADVYGVFNVMIVNTVLCAIFCLGLWLPATSNAPIIVFAILFGFTSGCIYSIIPAMVASFSDPRKIGVRSGSMYVLSAIGALVGSPIGGAIVNTQDGEYSGLIVFAGVGLLVGAGFAVAARQALVNGKLLAKV